MFANTEKIGPFGVVATWRAAWILAGVGLLVAVGAGAPVMGHGWNLVWILVGVSVMVGAAALASEAGSRAERYKFLGLFVPGLVMVVTLIGVAGLISTDVVGGRPVLSTSQEAKLLRFTATAVDRLYQLGDVDQLLGLDQVQGRLAISSLEDSYREVEKWSVEYDMLSAEELAVEDLVAVELVLEATIDQGLAAIDNHLRWLRTGDPVAQRIAAEHRQAMASGVLQAGAMLREVGSKYGIVFGEIEGGLVE